MNSLSIVPTRYAITCPKHGQLFLTKDAYDRQMLDADAKWACPLCGGPAEFDDENYERVKEDEEVFTPEDREAQALGMLEEWRTLYNILEEIGTNLLPGGPELAAIEEKLDKRRDELLTQILELMGVPE